MDASFDYSIISDILWGLPDSQHQALDPEAIIELLAESESEDPLSAFEEWYTAYRFKQEFVEDYYDYVRELVHDGHFDK